MVSLSIPNPLMRMLFSRKGRKCGCVSGWDVGRCVKCVRFVCSNASKKVIAPNEYGSITVNIALTDENGVANGKVINLKIREQVRRHGYSNRRLDETMEDVGLELIAPLGSNAIPTAPVA